VSLSEYFGMQIKRNGKNTPEKSREVPFIFTSYLICAALLIELTIGNVWVIKKRYQWQL